MFERGLFPALLDQRVAVYGYQANPYWLDLGTPINYLQVHRDLLGSGRYSYFTNPNYESSGGTRIHPSANITGQVVLGEGCYVGEEVTIEGPSILGSGCFLSKNNQTIWPIQRPDKTTPNQSTKDSPACQAMPAPGTFPLPSLRRLRWRINMFTPARNINMTFH